ncbi:MAG: hypothetical protein M3N24_00015 [Actinomycetota bacterium]|nr:hypothetical protein [Actinomycetota bacterium]
MEGSRWERYGAASGIAFAILAVATVLLVPQSPPAADDSLRRIQAYFGEHRDGLLVAGYLTGLAIAFALWFTGSLRSHLMRAEGGTGRIASIAFGAGLVAGTVALIGTAVTSALAFSVAQSTVPGSQAVTRAMFDFGNMAFSLAWFPIAVLVGATAIASSRTGALPGWHARISSVLSIAFLVAASSTFVQSGMLAAGGSYGYVMFLLFVAWILITSILLVQRVSAPDRPATDGARVDGRAPVAASA